MKAERFGDLEGSHVGRQGEQVIGRNPRQAFGAQPSQAPLGLDDGATHRRAGHHTHILPLLVAQIQPRVL